MKIRKFPIDPYLNIDPCWLKETPFLGVWMLAYGLLVAGAEKFIIGTCRKFIGSNTPESLRRDLTVCFGQEAQHAISHQVLADRACVQWPAVKIFLNLNQWLCYHALPAVLPKKVLLVAAATLEQINTRVAIKALQEHWLDSAVDETLKSMMAWHFQEEIEHREVVFNLMQTIKVPMWQVAMGVALTSLSFTLWTLAGALLLISMDIGHGVRLLRGVSRFFGPKAGLLRAMFASSLSLLDKDYHPSQDTLAVELVMS